MRFFVLGHRGMLGHVVSRYLEEQGHDVLTTYKIYVASHDCQMIREVQLSDADVIVNCIGRIRQKSVEASDLYLTNTVLPLQLLHVIAPKQKLVHISSDCVFSGDKLTPYLESDIPDPIDAYGSSKALAEQIVHDSRVTVFRTSIIGPEINTSYGLMAWFMKNPSKQVNGYTDHFWNGVTTLQLAKQIGSLELPTGKIFHVTSENSLSKFELLTQINDIWTLQKKLKMISTARPINHVLEGSIKLSSIEQQLKDLKEWY